MEKRSIFAANLRLLTGYRPSIASVCRDLGVSRQQYTKYLAGKNMPSVRNLQKISDYFGVEESEILLPVGEFRKLIALNPPQIENLNPMQAFIASSARIDANTRSELRKLLGYYYSHFRVAETPNLITRSLVCIYEAEGAILTKNIERYPDDTDGAASIHKFDGVATYNAGRLFIYEREIGTGTRIWQTVVYTNNLKFSTYLSGLTMGIATETVRDIACYRVVYEFLGLNVNSRRALRGCKTFDYDSPEISKYIRDRVVNDIQPHETAFVPRA